MDNLQEALNFYLGTEGANISRVCKKFNINSDDLVNALRANKYYKAGKSCQRESVIKYKEAAEYYIANQEHCTFTQVGKLFKINSTTLRAYIEQFYQNDLLKNYDDTVFDSIDTEEKAYWLGFIFADGYISTSNYQFEVSLKSLDIGHLQKLAKFFSKRTPLYCDETRCRLEISSKHLWNTLNNLGCVPRKSLILKFPEVSIFSDKKLIKHFIRGYWDGDGCLTYKRANYPTISVLGTEDMLSNIQVYLKTNKTLYNNSKTQDITKVLKINGKEAFEVTQYLYKDASIYLERKYNKYLEFCRLYEESCK